ncbi:unnamed protein product [Ranitomeya imitator]|uniref:ribonuclease H n=1 Tax=Ranitomeya imitator TaxID=111125 RepID=A0ABN9MG09_9NEOB|nr:unnamed protein product [Ranitomeya imitator]
MSGEVTAGTLYSTGGFWVMSGRGDCWDIIQDWRILGDERRGDCWDIIQDWRILGDERRGDCWDIIQDWRILGDERRGDCWEIIQDWRILGDERRGDCWDIIQDWRILGDERRGDCWDIIQDWRILGDERRDIWVVQDTGVDMDIQGLCSSMDNLIINVQKIQDLVVQNPMLEPRIPIPDLFYGDRAKFVNFKNNCKLFLALKPRSSGDPVQQVRIIISFLRGNPQDWAFSLAPGDPALSNIDAFFLALGLLYDEPNSVDQAEKNLLALCQGQDEIDIYCQKFRRWSVLTQWNEGALAAIFRKGLSEALKDGSLRPCIDYHLLNKITVKFQYPLPLLSDLFARIKGASWFTKIDLHGAYNLVRIKRGDEWKTAFNTPEGHFEYLVMPFGLANAPSVFQSFMHDIFREYLDKFLTVYLDDILVFSDDWESHVKQVRMVFQVLRANSLFVKGSKCLFGVQKVSFLGFIFSPSTIEMDPVKVQAIHDWTQPTSLKSLQKFLGFANFYRRFVCNFSSIAKPLTDLTKKGADVVNWSSAAVEVFKS